MYDTHGHKLVTEYFTQLTNITPLSDEQIVNQSYMSGVVDQTCTAPRRAGYVPVEPDMSIIKKKM